MYRQMPVEGGAWYRREVQGAEFEIYGAPGELDTGEDRIRLSAQEDAWLWLQAYASNGGEGLLSCLSETARRDLVETLPSDLMPVSEKRYSQIRLVEGSIEAPVRNVGWSSRALPEQTRPVLDPDTDPRLQVLV